MLHTFKAALEMGNYEDVPVLPTSVDPQLYMSRNTVAQPFYLICGRTPS
jgi:3-hydroxyanthranilate 3,4-dioxygenase